MKYTNKSGTEIAEGFDSAPASKYGGKLGRQGRRIRRGREGSSDQDGVGAGLGGRTDIVQSGHATLGDCNDVFGNAGEQGPSRPGVYGEGIEVPAVDPDKPRPTGQRRVELSRVVNFHKGIEAPLSGRSPKLGQSCRGQGPHY